MKRAAIFDLDGTLIRGTSAERLLVPWLVKAGVIGPRPLLAAGLEALTLPLVGRTRALRRNKMWLAGVSVAEVEGRMEAFLGQVVEAHWNAPVWERMEALRREDHTIYLLSGAPEFIVRAVGRRVEAEAAIGTAMEVWDGRFTGRLGGIHWFAAAKRIALETLAREHDLDLAASWAFADHVSDAPFLELVGHPVAVIGSERLLRVARARGWEVMEG